MFLRCLGSAEYLLPGVIPTRWCPYENDPGVQAGCCARIRTHTHTLSCLLTPHLSHRHSKVFSAARTGCAGLLCSNSGFSCFPLMPLIALSSPDGKWLTVHDYALYVHWGRLCRALQTSRWFSWTSCSLRFGSSVWCLIPCSLSALIHFMLESQYVSECFGVFLFVFFLLQKWIYPHDSFNMDPFLLVKPSVLWVFFLPLTESVNLYWISRWVVVYDPACGAKGILSILKKIPAVIEILTWKNKVTVA